MKKQLKHLILAAVLIITAVLSVSCSQWDPPYKELDENGYNVSVRFDANGGVFAGTENVYVVDVFSLANQKTNSDGMKEITLIEPDNKHREDRAFEVSKTNYFLAGWYAERTPRVDESGNPLDDYGVPTSESGKPQGYIYSKKWNFDDDKLLVDPSKEYTSTENVLTLYAAWIPYYTYEFYAPSSDGTTFELINTYQMMKLQIPEWNKETGKIDMFRFPELEGKTFDSAYLTEAMDEPISGTIEGQYDPERGITTTGTIKIYTKWLEGDWYKIYSADQFYKNSKLSGNYIICDNLDFSGTVWSPALTKGAFTGKIYGNGYKFSNITVIQADNTQMNGGLFGTISSGAVIENLTLENVTFTVEAGSRMQGASFGLLAGSVSEGATFDNVAIQGTLKISPNCYPQTDYFIGLLCGNCANTEAISSSVTCTVTDEASDAISVETDEATGRVTLTFNN